MFACLHGKPEEPHFRADPHGVGLSARRRQPAISFHQQPLTFPSSVSPTPQPWPKRATILRRMASTASPSFSLLRASRRYGYPPPERSRHGRVFASDASKGAPPFRRRKGTPGVDTRIHWSNPDEGWVGDKSRPADAVAEKNENLGGRFADLISASTTSHYQFLGVPADADMEEIKAAYRRLSKEYHPDTTVLPLKTASQKFVQLREAYNVLSEKESRRFYDWTLAQEAESRRAERMRMKLEDPYMQDVRNWESIPDTVDRLGGKNMKLSDQATTALTIDVFIILFSICCILYVVFFKEPY